MPSVPQPADLELGFIARIRALRPHEYLIFAIILISLALCLAVAPFVHGAGAATPAVGAAPPEISGMS